MGEWHTPACPHLWYLPVSMRRVAFLWLLLLPAGLRAQPPRERILDFHSDIAVDANGSMLVRETVAVNVAGRRIQHGIYRDFPTRYHDRFGNDVVVDFDILAVERDGLRERWSTEPQADGVRVYLGDENSLVPVGRHEYAFTYQTRRQLGYFSDHDELYWNVTGNGWVFPIDEASASVTLPSNVAQGTIQLTGYTGRQGSHEQTLHGTTEPGPRATFEVTRHLDAGEGLTIVVSWPKGFVTAPTAPERFGYMLHDNRNLLAGIAGTLLLLTCYLLVWRRALRARRAPIRTAATLALAAEVHRTEVAAGRWRRVAVSSVSRLFGR